MKWSHLVKGTKAEKRVTFRYSGKDIDTLLRPLSLAEEIQVIANAVEHAQKKGVKEPKPGDPIYEAFVKAETLALACLDPDSSEDGRGRTFDGGVKDILELDDVTVTILFEQHGLWQEECSPAMLTKDTKALFKLAQEVCERGDPFEFVSLPRVTQWRLLLITGLLLFNSPVLSSLRSLISEGTDFESLEGRTKLVETLRAMQTSASTSPAAPAAPTPPATSRP